MNKKQIIEKVIQKKKYSQLPIKDVEAAFSHFEKRQVSDEEKIRLTRELLHKVFGVFTSRKILSPKDKDVEWILRKHLSTRERLPYYNEIYKRILKTLGKKHISIIDLGAGINGFSYNFFSKLGFVVNYTAVEALGQLVDLMNSYFKKENVEGRAVHLSLFELEDVKRIIKKQSKPRIVFLFKTVDSLEILKRNYSKKLILEIGSMTDKIVVSFATESITKRKRFYVKRTWILNFIKENFKILDDFTFGGEKYLVFEKK